MKAQSIEIEGRWQVRIVDGDQIIRTINAPNKIKAIDSKRLIAAGLMPCIDPRSNEVTQCGMWGVNGSPACHGHRVDQATWRAFLAGTLDA